MIDLTNPKELKMLLASHGMAPKRHFSQNFLISSAVVTRICESLEFAAGVLEIGPGPGALTSKLSEKDIELIAIELDPIAVSALAETAPKSKILSQDVLKTDLKEILLTLPEPRAIVSNMPYHITGPLLGKIAEARPYFQQAILMMQKEVGERVMAQPGDSECGSLSIFLQSQFKIRHLLSVKNTAYYPPPKVDSVVLELTPKTDADLNQLNSNFFVLLRESFLHPRKTLINNILKSGKYSKIKVEDTLNELELSLSIRPHQLSIQNWKMLSWILHK